MERCSRSSAHEQRRRRGARAPRPHAVDRLRFFLADAANDPEQPHPYAAHLTVIRLAARLFHGAMDGANWEAVPYAEIRCHAAALFDEDKARLTTTG